MKFTKETARRAIRTFIQTLVGYIAVNLPLIDFSAGVDAVKSALLGILVAGVASGISALMNTEKGGVDNG